MEKVAEFSKVSFEQFKKDWEKNIGVVENLQSIYDEIKLPMRATKGSAGYDFYAPTELVLNAGESVFVPTGIRVKIDEGWLLALFPRSGLGIKYRLQLDNTTGIIDSDYFFALNEGHIMAKITNDTKEEKTVHIEKGAGFIQGVFLPYGICYNDESEGVRVGGFGSTS